MTTRPPRGQLTRLFLRNTTANAVLRQAPAEGLTVQVGSEVTIYVF